MKTTDKDSSGRTCRASGEGFFYLPGASGEDGGNLN